MDVWRNVFWEVRCILHSAWMIIWHSIFIPEERNFLTDRKNIVLLYGFGGAPGCMIPIKEKLESLGYNVLLPDLGMGPQPIENLVLRLRIFLRKKEEHMVRWSSCTPEGLGKNLVFFGYSMGGLVALELLRRFPEYRGARVITCGTPFRGTRLARLSSLIFLASRDLVPGSEYLRSLRDDLISFLPDLYQVSAWSDEIAPRSSTALPEFPAYILSAMAGHAALMYLDFDTLQYVFSKH